MASVEHIRALAAKRAKKYRDKTRANEITRWWPDGPIVWTRIPEEGRPRYWAPCRCGGEMTTYAQCVHEVRRCADCKKAKRD